MGAKQAQGILDGKVALVTGGASGIGRACVLAFAREGAAAVVVADRDEEGGHETAREAEKLGAEAHCQPIDVSDETQVESLVREAVARHGRLDCAVNNAGIAGPTALLHQIDAEAWSQTLAVNLTGVFLCMKHEIAAMKAQGGEIGRAHV